EARRGEDFCFISSEMGKRPVAVGCAFREADGAPTCRRFGAEASFWRSVRLTPRHQSLFCRARTRFSSPQVAAAEGFPFTVVHGAQGNTRARARLIGAAHGPGGETQGTGGEAPRRHRHTKGG